MFLNRIKIIIKNILFLFIFKIKSGIKKNEWYLICPGGIGDTFFICILARELLKKHCGQAVNLIVKPDQKEIPALFPDIKNIYLLKTDNPYGLNLFRKFQPGRLFLAHPIIRPGLLDFLGYNNIYLLDLYRVLLEIPLTAPIEFSMPVISDSIKKSAQDKFSKYLLKEGKTVILFPEAHSVMKIDIEFWKKLAESLKSAGWTVCTNVIKDEKEIENTIPVSFSLAEAIPFTDLAGWAISLRSGICDLLAFAEAKLTIIYPQQRWYSGTVFTGSNLKSMRLTQRAKECVINQNNLQETINEIMEAIL